MNGIAGEYLIIVNRMNIAEVGHLVIETQKRSSNDRSGSSSFEQLRRESRGQGSG